MNLRTLLFPLLCAVAVSANAAVATNTPTARETEGRELAKKLLEQSPSENSTITGVLQIRQSRSKRTEIPMQFRIVVTDTNWQTIYETLPNTNGITEQFVVSHDRDNRRYQLNGMTVADDLAAVPFAGSDFWLTDLGLEFLRWPSQKVLRKEIRRSRFCVVLESVRGADDSNASQQYSRVVSWIDNETDGILHADAYDAKGKRIKEFEPKEFKKINGQWQLTEMRMDNLKTGSRSTLQFNLTIDDRPKP
ncbi:MAG TPA: outer membrane lipoprotein-sorting protein [Verrucomicrobiota bacterium]|nr:outer membrane lipoprotein-sorting protein [Verrucomicrobiota bacterium]